MVSQRDAREVLVEKLGHPGSERLKKIIARLLTPREVAAAVALPVASPQELAGKLRIGEAEAAAILDSGYRKGVFFPTSRGHFFARTLTQFHDATLVDRRWDGLVGEEFFRLWDEFMEQEWYPKVMTGPVEEAGMAGGGMRVVPARGSLKGVAGVIPQEDLDAILQEAEAFAVTPCSCRRQTLNRCGKAVDVCVQLNRGATYAIQRGSGRALSRGETQAVFDETARSGLVSIFPLRPRLAVVCNCCEDCCMDIHPKKVYNKLDLLTRSRYVTRVDLELCTGCQDCVERCPFDAIEMTKHPQHKRLKAAVDEEKCFGCGVCVVGCAPEAMRMEAVRPESHVLQYYG